MNEEGVACKQSLLLSLSLARSFFFGDDAGRREMRCPRFESPESPSFLKDLDE